MEPVRYKDIVVSSEQPDADASAALSIAEVYAQYWLKNHPTSEPIWVHIQPDDGPDICYRVDCKPLS